MRKILNKIICRFCFVVFNFWGILLILFLLQGVFSELTAQPSRKVQRWFDEARSFYSLQEYDRSVLFCNQILNAAPDYADAHLLLADIYFETNKREKEVYHLKEARKISETPLLTWRLANALFSNGTYSEALKEFLNYSEPKKITDERKKELDLKIESCKFAIDAINNPVDFEPYRLPETVNSEFDEYWPSLSIDRKQLVFTRLIKDAVLYPQEDFYYSELIDDEWQAAVPITEINTSENEGAQTLSADGKLLFFTACNRNDVFGSCDIYYSVRVGEKWTKPVNAGSPVNTSYWEAQPSLSSDGKFLYFSSNRPGGEGKKDIWRAESLGFDKNGKLKWKEPVNLGSKINTPGNETSPFVHSGNSNFYFASDSHIGMGGFDLYMSIIENDTLYSKPENLGYPVNTHNDEQGLHISADGLTAFYSTMRDSAYGLDIYSFQLDETLRPNPATYVKANVFDSETNEPVQAVVQLNNLEKPESSERSETTDKNGELFVSLPAGNNYSFSVSCEGYLFYSNTFDLKNTREVYDPYLLKIALLPVKPGAEMNLYNIYFETDSFNILPESKPELDKLVLFLTENSSLKVEIQGHTDNSGNAAKNMVLSEKRARSVTEFLIENSIESRRLEWKGYGETRPVSENETPGGRQLNRRTTIKILND